MQHPHILISHVELIPSEWAEDFKEELVDLDIFIEKRENDGPYAGLEWFLPTFLAVYIAKPYFSAFIQEAGKEHYHKLKNSLSSLTKKSMRNPRVEPYILGTSGKVNQVNPYTMIFSIMAEGKDGYTFKLLLPKYAAHIDYDEIINTFVYFLAEFHESNDLGAMLSNIGVVGLPHKQILLRYNPETTKIEWQDHMPEEVRAKQRITSAST